MKTIKSVKIYFKIYVIILLLGWIHSTHPSDSEIKCDTDIGTCVVTSDYLCPGSAVRIQTCD
mgnify:CR=1 FL=1